MAVRLWSLRNRRQLVRAGHLLVSAVLGAVVYAPEPVALALRPVAQTAAFPLIAATGLWLWQGHRLGRPRLSPSHIVPTGTPSGRS